MLQPICLHGCNATTGGEIASVFGRYCNTASQSLNTQRFMLFHLPHLYEVMQHFPQADVLFWQANANHVR